NLRPIDFRRRSSLVRLSKTTNLLGPLGAFKGQKTVFFHVTPILTINLIEKLIQGQPQRFREGGDLGEHDRCAVRILVTHEIGSAVPVAFLAAENEKAEIAQTSGSRLLFR